jgi:hypothetical protein
MHTKQLAFVTSRDVPVICIQKASAPRTDVDRARGLLLVTAAEHTADLRPQEP